MNAMDSDQTFLRSEERPPYEEGAESLRIVDLFCGAGGLTLGLAEAARQLGLAIEIPLAVDFDEDVCAVYSANFPKANAVASNVAAQFDGCFGEEPTGSEQSLANELARVDFLVGGPPCQGHSDLNNHTRRDDPRNSFYERMGRAAEILKPAVLLIENVPPVRHDESGVVERTVAHLEHLGYDVAQHVISLADLGVSQSR